MRAAKEGRGGLLRESESEETARALRAEHAAPSSPNRALVSRSRAHLEVRERRAADVGRHERAHAAQRLLVHGALVRRPLVRLLALLALVVRVHADDLVEALDVALRAQVAVHQLAHGLVHARARLVERHEVDRLRKGREGEGG